MKLSNQFAVRFLAKLQQFLTLVRFGGSGAGKSAPCVAGSYFSLGILVLLALLSLGGGAGVAQAVGTTLAAGFGYSLTLGSDGKLYAWGANHDGQLGNGSMTNSNTPVEVGLPTGLALAAVAAGQAHSLALGSDGKLYAWGRNSDGQLGNGSMTNSTTPVEAGLFAGLALTAVSAGAAHSLALGSDGKLYAWGFNFSGQLGNGSNTPSSIPVVVRLPAGVKTTAVSAGEAHNLALGSDGKLYAWGFNSSGQLGNGSASNRNTPVVVRLPGGVTPTTAVAAAAAHSLALGSDGKLYAWGANHHGQLGNGSNTPSTIPVVVRLPAGVKPTAVAAAAAHSLALGSDGKLYAWGSNLFGQLGNGSTTGSTVPVVVSLPAGVTTTAVAAGQWHGLALASDRKLYAWGKNRSGELGNGSMTNSTTPVEVGLPAGLALTAVSAGAAHSLALGSDGKLFAPRQQAYGQLKVKGSLAASATSGLVHANDMSTMVSGPATALR